MIRVIRFGNSDPTHQSDFNHLFYHWPYAQGRNFMLSHIVGIFIFWVFIGIELSKKIINSQNFQVISWVKLEIRRYKKSPKFQRQQTFGYKQHSGSWICFPAMTTMLGRLLFAMACSRICSQNAESVNKSVFKFSHNPGLITTQIMPDLSPSRLSGSGSLDYKDYPPVICSV